MAINNRPTMSTEEAINEARATIRAAGIRGLRALPESSGDYICAEFERADRRVNCTLYVRTGYPRTEKATWKGAGENEMVFGTTIVVEITWSSTGRTPAEAIACIKLYTEVAELAAELEARFAHDRIGEVLDVTPKAG